MNTSDDFQYDLDGNPVATNVDLFPSTPDEKTNDDSQSNPEEVIEGDVNVPVSDMSEIITSMEMMLDLHHTIQLKGVSKNDVIAFKALSGKILPPNNEKTATPALEMYPLGYYTDERSGVNLNYAMESFGRTIIDAIKTVFRKLIEMVRYIYRVHYKHINTTNVQIQLETKTRALKKGRQLLLDNIRIYGAPADINKRMGETAIDVLVKHFTVNDLLLTLFGSERKSDVKLLLITTKSSVTEIKNITQALSAIIDGKASIVSGLVDHNKLKRLEHSAKMTVDLTTPPTLHGENWIRQFILDNTKRSENIFDLVDFETLSEYVKADEVIDVFHACINTLEKANRAIQKYKPDTDSVTTDINAINEYAAILTNSVNHVKTIMDFIVNYNQLKLKVIAAVYNNDSTYASEIFRQARVKTIDENAEKALFTARNAMADVYKVITN